MWKYNRLMGRMYREGEGGDGGAGGGGGNVTPPAGGTPSFRDSLPEEFKDHAALKDYTDLGGLVKSHVNLQSMLGNAIQLPKEGESWDPIYNKLGRPEKPDQYEFKLADQFKDRQLDPKLTDWAKTTFHKHGLTAKQAEGLLNDYVQREVETGTGAKNLDETLDEYEGKCEEIFGDKWEETQLVVERASKMFVDQDDAAFFNETGLGSHPTFVKIMAKVGKLLQEDKAFSEGANNAGFTPDANTAKAEIARLNTDSEFMTAYMTKDHAGHKAAVERMTNLYKIASPGKVKT
ncbi:MAG TPA: hypothetical protein VD999_07930 [Vitreimonas sp.]|nr:hypothetical protein [Vitreimonas sp.]